MALKLKYTDEHGIVHINMSPNSSPRDTELKDPKFDTINNRFGSYDLFGGKYGPKEVDSYDLFGAKHTSSKKIDSKEVDSSGDEPQSLFRSRYNSIEEELANTPYAFATERSLRSANQLDITIDRSEISPSKDIEDDRFFHRRLSLEYEDLFRENTPAFTVTQLIHAQDRYFNLSSREKSEKGENSGDNKLRTESFEKPSFVVKETPEFEKAIEKSSFANSERSGFEKPGSDCSSLEKSGCQEDRRTKSGSVERIVPVPSARVRIDESLRVQIDDSAFKVLNSDVNTQTEPIVVPVVPLSKRKKEKSFAILTETPTSSRPSSPRSLPVDIRQRRVSPFKGRGFREETSRHNTPRTSAANSRANSPPPRRRTNSLSRIDNMATVSLPSPIQMPLPHSPRNFLKENIEEVREISELNREIHEAEATMKKIEEEEAILKEMGLSETEAKIEATRSVVGSKNNSRTNSRTNSRSNSPSKINLRSRSSSPSTKLDKSKIKDNKESINDDDGLTKPVTHRSRGRSVSKSQPQSNNGSPKHSKIPKRQSSVSPMRTTTKTPARRDNFISRRPVSNNLNNNQRFISNSTSSIHETIKIGSQVHDKRGMSKSTQHLNISPAHIRGKPPISPGRGGPPPSNKTINAKRLSPIVGTPNKSPTEDLKPGSGKTSTKLSTTAKKTVKNSTTPAATSRINSRAPSKAPSRDTSPDKRRNSGKATTTSTSKPTNNSAKTISRTPSSKSIQKPSTPPKIEPKRSISRTDSMKSLNRTTSTKNLAEKPPLKRRDSKLSDKNVSNGKINEAGIKRDSIKDKNKEPKGKIDSATDPEEILKQDNETQYDKATNDKGELVIMTKKNIVSMTTAAITSQPLEVVTAVTNQLPVALEKAREKRNIERLNSKDSLIGKDLDKAEVKVIDEKKKDTKIVSKSKDNKNNHDKHLFAEDNHKLKPLQPPFNDPQLEKVQQKIDDILKTPEISRENILTPSAKLREAKFKNFAEKTKTEVKESKDALADKLTDLKDQVIKQQEEVKAEIRTETSKIVNSVITPVEETKELKENQDVPAKVVEIRKEVKKDIIEPIVMVVNEKKKDSTETVEKVNETLVKGEAEVEVQNSNIPTPGETTEVKNKAGGNGSDKSQSNGGYTGPATLLRFPQSTSTTPKPPARSRKEQKEKDKEQTQSPSSTESEIKNSKDDQQKKPNICSRLMGKCKSKCCSCCVKGEGNETEDVEEQQEEIGKKEKQGMMSKFGCCKKKDKVEEEVEKNLERAAGKGATIEFEDETKRKRKFRDIICCCDRRRRVTDSSIPAQNVADVTMSPRVTADSGVVGDAGCCGKKRQVERRDSILSDRPPANCCNRLCIWLRGMCRRRAPPAPPSRRASMFSKNKSLSPTLPPEDTRKKLDPTLIEHTSMIRAAIPILPIVLAYFCLICNVVVPGLGSIFSGLFCLCFGIPRFGPHDGAKYRIGSFVINLLVGVGQLFTVLFCLVGWGWSIWWGVIMIRISRKYRRIRKEARQAEAEAAPPVTTNNHMRA